MAQFQGFCGGTYTGRALAIDGERAINFYPERMESQGAVEKTQYALFSKPGLQQFATFPNADSVQALWSENGRLFAVAGGVFYEVLPDGSHTGYGSVGTGRVQMCASQSQVLILATNKGYIFDLILKTLTQITATGFPAGASKCGFSDGYFVVLEPASQVFAISALNDGTQWDALDFGDAEGEPGNVVSFIVDHRQMWFLCTTHGEVYYNSGNANFPYARLEGAFMEQGTSAIDSPAKCDNTIFWLGGNRDGAGIVWRANGYTPQRVSNHAIEALIESFGDISDATAYCYQEGGHTFYRLDFPSANEGLGATLLYDVASGFWHERTYLVNGIEQADLARCHAYCFGLHIVGDYQSGTLYIQSMSYNTDAGAPIRRLRAAPDISDGGLFRFYSELRLLMQVGMGLDGTGQGTDPQIILQCSNDGGFTWGNERSKSCGKIGQFKKLVRWKQLGRSQNRCFRIIITEPIFVAIISADLDSSNG